MSDSRWGIFATRDEAERIIPDLPETTVFPIFVMFYEQDCAVYSRDQFIPMINQFWLALIMYHDKTTGQNTILPPQEISHDGS